MNQNQSLREHLLALLDGRQAHLNFQDILQGVPFELQGRKPDAAPHTLWQLLEHIRIAQWDIFEFSRGPGHVSPAFPKGYWPSTESPPEENSWETSVASFGSDLRGMRDLVADPTTDLHAPVAHGSGQTILREALLIADHNSYHLGQIVLVRRLLGCAPDVSLS